MVIHVLLGVTCAYLTLFIFPDSDRSNLVVCGILGSLLPDIDHIFMYFVYGKKSLYAQIAKSYLVKKQLRHWARFVKINHKLNTGLYSHNFVSVALSLFFFYYFGILKSHTLITVFFMAWTSHYLFDMWEDILFLKTLNPNWYFKFNTTPDSKLLEHISASLQLHPSSHSKTGTNYPGNEESS
jgi:hypothetical protein